MTIRLISRIISLAFLGIVFLIFALLYYYGIDFVNLVLQLKTFIDHYPVFSFFSAVIIYIIATIFCFPGYVILTLCNGFLFGFWIGFLCNSFGSVVGATLAFLISRYLGYEWFDAHVTGKLRAIKVGVEQEGWKFLAFIRFLPISPFNFASYALGLTKIPLSVFVFITAVFNAPTKMLGTYIGSLGLEFISGEKRGLMMRLSLAVSGMIIAALLPWLIRLYQRFKSIYVRNKVAKS